MKKFILIFALFFYLPLNAQVSVPPSSGDGSQLNPYQIASLQNLYWIAESSSRAAFHYIQTADIDASETSTWFPDTSVGYNGWPPVGDKYTYSFSGTYNGGGYTIKNLYLNRPGVDYIGLFGSTYSASISNLGLVNVSISGRHYAGGMVGYNYNSTINSSYCIGNVAGSWYVGVLVGSMTSNSTISYCYSDGSASGSPMIGGLVGEAEYSSAITNSYSRANVTGGLYEFGGLLGAQYYSSSVSNCYSTGTVSGPNWNLGGLIGRIYGSPTATNCFWDTETSGIGSSAGGTGKSTADMKAKSTFTGAGWDFTNIWDILEGYYPKLKSTPDTALPVELTSFSAAVQKRSVTLKWTTATEINNLGFDIERLNLSNPSEAWAAVGFVKGNNTTTEKSDYVFIDNSLVPGRYCYRLKQIDMDGTYSYSKTVETDISALFEFTLDQNYPNPFNNSSVIRYAVPEPSLVNIRIYDILGNEIETLVNEFKPAGMFQVHWQAANLPSGTYICRMQSGKFEKTAKMILMK